MIENATLRDHWTCRRVDVPYERPQRTPRQRLRGEFFEQTLRDLEQDSTAAVGPLLRARVRRVIDSGLKRARLNAVTARERTDLEEAVLAELSGLGPLDPLMHDPTVSDILVNGAHDVWVDRFGRLERTNIRFDDDDHVMRMLSRLVSSQGRHLEEATPYVDVRLEDGSRLHATIPPISSDGPVIAIRRSRSEALRLEQLYACGTLSRELGVFLGAAVRSGCSVLISGGAATGKTTMLNVLSQFIPETERVVTIEETAELKLDHPHVIPLEARQPNVESRGEVTLRTLVRNSLRLRADRIIVGEVRGGEVFDMLQAMNIGHNGSMTTVHANSPQDALRRLETLALTAGLDMGSGPIRELLGSAFDLIVHMTRFPDGARRITRVGDVVLAEGRVPTSTDVYHYGPSAGAEDAHRVTGVQPACLERIRRLEPAAVKLFDREAAAPGEDPA